jgi:hypothetical protein
MSTTDTVFLIITACAISLFFVLGSVVLVVIIKLVSKVKAVVNKAEEAIDSVETATESLRNIGKQASGPVAALKVIGNIIKLVNRK